MAVNIGSDVNVLGGESLNLQIQLLLNEIETNKRSRNIKTFKDPASLGLTDATLTLLELQKRMPLNSQFVYEVLGGTHGPTLPCPYFTGGSIKNYMSGKLIAIKGNAHEKMQFLWSNESYMAWCAYNALGVTPFLKPWKFVNAGLMGSATGMTARQFENLISNIWVQGTYYWSRAAFMEFTDRCTDNGGWLTVEGDPTFGLVYTFKQNGPYVNTWRKVGTSPWVYQPGLLPVGTSDANMMTGDMRPDGTGRLLIRTSPTKIINLDMVNTTP